MYGLQITAPGMADWVEMPDPIAKENEVVIEVEAVSTCPHWDMRIFGGTPMFAGRPLQYPYTPGEPGHECVGRIASVGAAVTQVRPGDRVAAWRDPGGRRQGAYAQYVAVEADHVIIVPEDLPAAALASLELAMCVHVSIEQLERAASIKGKRVGVTGLGPSGLIAVQMLRAYGAAEIIAVDLAQDRCALGRTYGATQTGVPDDLMADQGRYHERAFSLGLDTTGISPVIERLIRNTRDAVAIFGVMREPIQVGPEHWYGGFQLMMYGEHHRGAAEQALHLITEGKLDLTPLISTQLPLTQYADGVAQLTSKEAIKVLFTPA